MRNISHYPIELLRQHEERFWSLVDKGAGETKCWPFTGPTNGKGYGNFSWAHRGRMRAHRMAYELVVGPIPDPLQIDHLCRTKLCCNPGHLEPVTHGENLRRGMAGWNMVKKRMLRTHCERGRHLFVPENIVIRPNGDRNCRPCRAAYWRRWRRKKKAALDAKAVEA